MAFCDLFSGAHTAARLTHLIMITIRTTARPTGVPGKLPALRCLMSAALQAKSPADDTQILSSNSPPAEEASLQKTHFPPASHADPCRSWNPCNLRDAQLKHLVEKCPPGHQVYSDVFNLLHVLHCNRSALHSAALF